jgi:hypothetical protein
VGWLNNAATQHRIGRTRIPAFFDSRVIALNNPMIRRIKGFLLLFCSEEKGIGTPWICKRPWKRVWNMSINPSGEYGVVETSYVFPIPHMVAPKEKALACTDPGLAMRKEKIM